MMRWFITSCTCLIALTIIGCGSGTAIPGSTPSTVKTDPIPSHIPESKADATPDVNNENKGDPVPDDKNGAVNVAETSRITFGATPEHSIQIPTSWKREAPSSNMRILQVRIPKTSGDSEDAELAVFNASGGVDANVQRWSGQFGGDDSLKGKRTLKTASGLEAIVVELEGTYTAMTMQGTQAPKPNYKMLGAIIIMKGGELQFKLPGSRKTIDGARAAFDRMIESFK